MQAKVAIVVLGRLRYPLDLKVLQQWQSRIFSISTVESISVLPNPDLRTYEYSDKLLSNVVKSPNNVDLTVAIINAPLENNFYMRRLRSNAAAISLFEVGEYVVDSGNTLEQFVLRNLYELNLIYRAKNWISSDNYAQLAHEDIRGCLFDMNINKVDLTESLHQPQLCTPCHANYSQKQLPAGFLAEFEKELKRIRKPLYGRILQWVKSHPLIALVITTFAAISTNMIASLLYDYLKSLVA